MTALQNLRPPARTPESVRQEAATFFAERVEWAQRYGGRDADRLQQDQVVGARLVDAALDLEDGAELDLDQHVFAGAQTELERQARWAENFRVIPYLCGSLKLLEMDFAHPIAGSVPYGLVGELLRGAESVTHQGVSMTSKDVVFRLRRVPLDFVAGFTSG